MATGRMSKAEKKLRNLHRFLDDKTTEVVAAVRKALGPEIKLMIDVQYRWKNADEALRTVKDWAEFDIYFLEFSPKLFQPFR